MVDTLVDTLHGLLERPQGLVLPPQVWVWGLGVESSPAGVAYSTVLVGPGVRPKTKLDKSIDELTPPVSTADADISMPRHQLPPPRSTRSPRTGCGASRGGCRRCRPRLCSAAAPSTLRAGWWSTASAARCARRRLVGADASYAARRGPPARRRGAKRLGGAQGPREPGGGRRSGLPLSSRGAPGPQLAHAPPLHPCSQASLIATYFCGPRLGRFDVDGLPQRGYRENNSNLVVLGTFLLWFGWWERGPSCFVRICVDSSSGGLQRPWSICASAAP
jgi:hypothetical protein